MLIKLSRGSRAGVAEAGFTTDDCSAHLSVTVLGSTVPKILEADREAFIKDGGWTSEYAFEASRPAYRRITRDGQ